MRTWTAKWISMSKAGVVHSSEYITNASVKSLASSMKLRLYSIHEEYRKYVSYKYGKLEVQEYAVLRTETQGCHILTCPVLGLLVAMSATNIICIRNRN